MRLFCEFQTQPGDEGLDRALEMDLLHRSHIKYERHSDTAHSLTTMKTLSAGYNEMVQTTDFFKQLKKVHNDLSSIV